MTLGPVSLGYLHLWKELILSEVARAIADPEMQKVQRETGVWALGGQLAYPEKADISVIKNGCLNFSRDFANEAVLFSVWMQPGEVRVGVKIPNDFIGTNVHRETLSKMCDGKACPRIKPVDQHTFFDWIWKDEDFAAFDFMVASIQDEMKAAVLAERIYQALIHLYLSTASTLITLMKFKLVDGRIVQAGQDVWTAKVGGDIAALEWFLGRNGGVFIEQKKVAENQFDCVFTFPSERKRTIDTLIGQSVQDQDGSRCILVRAILGAEA